MKQRTKPAIDNEIQKDKYSKKTPDSKVADTENCTYPEGIRLYKDTGYLGYIPKSVVVMAPFKKPQKRKLSALQKWFNKTVSQVRIAVEHAIAGIKRYCDSN